MNDPAAAPRTSEKLREHFAGVLLGTAVGDSLGLPAEGLTRGRIARWWQGGWRHRFVLEGQVVVLN